MGGGRYFQMEVSTVVYNGLDGAPRWPAIPNGKNADGEQVGDDLRLTVAEQQAVVTHAKEELRQRWAPVAIDHRLRAAGWPDLPAETFKLPRPLSMKQKRQPKPKPKPKRIRLIQKPSWRSRDERLEARAECRARLFK